MRARILDFVQALRAREVDVSLAESLDAVAAVARAGVERDVLREALAASLVKHEADRTVFDPLFDEMFPLVGGGDEATERGRRRARGGGGDGAPGRGGSSAASGGRGGPSARDDADETSRGGGRDGDARERPAPAAPRDAQRPRPADAAAPVTPRGRAARRQALLARPFRDMTAADVDEARALVRELGRRLRTRLARRTRRARRGRLDFRRTIRAATSSGGVPIRPRFRTRRPVRPDLVALCDLSGSVAAASELLLGLVAPAGDWFRRTHLFAYVDALCPVSIEDGHVAPAGPLDLYARSDFGRVLDGLWRTERRALTASTVVVVLGDARNNRRPPRVDLLRRVRERVQRLVWLVPEPRVRWDTGDSVIGRYAPVCDAVFECVDLAALLRAVRATL